MKKTVLILAIALFVFNNTGAFAQTAGERPVSKPTEKTTVQTTDKKGWTSEARQNFISSCIESAMAIGEDSARFYCYCMQEKIEKRFPNAEEADKLSAEDLQKPEWKKIINDCITSIGSWTKKDRSDFMTECVKAAKDDIGEVKANSYCECMLFKLEKKFPNPNDANITEEMLATPEWKKVIKECTDF